MARPKLAGPARQLLDAAAGRFAATGFAGTSVRAILRDAGVGPTVLYYHFGSKEGLYAAVLERTAREYRIALLRATSGPGSVVERIRRGCGVPIAWRNGALHEQLAATLKELVVEGIDRHELAPCDPGVAARALSAIAAQGSPPSAALDLLLEKLRFDERI